jgi:hypothetical protein
MYIRHTLLAILITAVAACGGSGQPGQSTSGVKRTADGLLIVPSLDNPQVPIPDPSPAGSNPDPKRYIIFWAEDEYEFDGYYDFVVHPTQMFLRYTDTNSPPKPEFVFWVVDISPDQYRAIGDSLNREVNRTFAPEVHRKHEGYTLFRYKDGKPTTWPNQGSDAQMLHKMFIDIMNRNLQDILKNLNAELPSGVEPLFLQPTIVTGDRRLEIRRGPG